MRFTRSPLPSFLWLRWSLRLCAVAAVVGLILALVVERRHSAKLAERVGALTQARADDAQRFKQAAIQAAQDQRANIARVAAHQQSISREDVSGYKAELAAWRERYTSAILRRNREADPGRARSSDLPGVSAPAARVADAAADFAERCGEDAIQLGAVIAWTEHQAKVDPNEGTKQ
jgi:hypothetical protein